jgi:Flp pilus assembly protein TadG
MNNHWKRQLKKLIGNEQGNVLVLVALSMVVLCGFTALVTDVGSLFLEKSQLQKSVDAAALAGAQKLPESQNDAVDQAIAVAAKNNVTITDSDVKTGTDTIQISKKVTKDLTFARVLGFNTADVSAAAKVQVGGALTQKVGVIPIGIEQRDFQKGAVYSLNFTNGNSYTGNFGFLAIDGKGGNVLGDSIENGVQSPVTVPSTVLTKPGLTWGPVRDGIQARIDADAHTPNCNSYDTATAQCRRVVYVPIVESYSFANGRSDVNIIGIAAFWLKEIDGHSVVGQFINLVTSGDFTPPGDPADFGVYTEKLVQPT